MGKMKIIPFPEWITELVIKDLISRLKLNLIATTSNVVVYVV